MPAGRRLALLAAMAVGLSFGQACSKSNPAPARAGDSAAPPAATLVVTSTAFAAGAAIPVKFTCDGDDVSPALSWSGAPPSTTKSFALIVDDPDAPGGTFTHWLLFDVPVATNALAEGATGIGIAGKNGFDVIGYRGPCPPKGKGAHHYSFRVYALDVGTLGLPDGASRADLEAALIDHVLARGEVVGTFEH